MKRAWLSVSHEFTVNRSSLDHCEWRFGCKWIESGPLSKHCHDYFHFFFYFIGLSHSEDILTSQSREGTDVINKNNACWGPFSCIRVFFSHWFTVSHDSPGQLNKKEPWLMFSGTPVLFLWLVNMCTVKRSVTRRTCWIKMAYFNKEFSLSSCHFSFSQVIRLLAGDINTTPPWCWELPVPTGSCTADWANLLSSATVSSR